MLVHTATLCSIIGGTTRPSSKEASPLYVPISHTGGLRLLQVLANTHYWTFLITVILEVERHGVSLWF